MTRLRSRRVNIRCVRWPGEAGRLPSCGFFAFCISQTEISSGEGIFYLLLDVAVFARVSQWHHVRRRRKCVRVARSAYPILGRAHLMCLYAWRIRAEKGIPVPSYVSH